MTSEEWQNAKKHWGPSGLQVQALIFAIPLLSRRAISLLKETASILNEDDKLAQEWWQACGNYFAAIVESGLLHQYLEARSTVEQCCRKAKLPENVTTLLSELGGLTVGYHLVQDRLADDLYVGTIEPVAQERDHTRTDIRLIQTTCLIYRWGAAHINGELLVDPKIAAELEKLRLVRGENVARGAKAKSSLQTKAAVQKAA